MQGTMGKVNGCFWMCSWSLWGGQRGLCRGMSASYGSISETTIHLFCVKLLSKNYRNKKLLWQYRWKFVKKYQSCGNDAAVASEICTTTTVYAYTRSCNYKTMWQDQTPCFIVQEGKRSSWVSALCSKNCGKADSKHCHCNDHLRIKWSIYHGQQHLAAVVPREQPSKDCSGRGLLRPAWWTEGSEFGIM